MDGATRLIIDLNIAVVLLRLPESFFVLSVSKHVVMVGRRWLVVRDSFVE
jgi:hypothetical protein